MASDGTTWPLAYSVANPYSVLGLSEPSLREPPAAGQRLDSWKEIAAYLGRGVRTVQRWERTAGLPVHRLPHEKRDSVYAHPDELTAWWNARGNTLSDDAEPPPVVKIPVFRRLTIPAAAALCAAAGLGTWHFGWVRDSAPRVPRIVPLTTYRGLQSEPAFSPDGSRIAFTWWREPDIQAAVYAHVIGTSGVPLLLAESARSPAWSPDGRFVSFLSIRPGCNLADLSIVPSLGGPPRKIAEIQAPAHLPAPYQLWTKDGNWIVVPDRASSAEPYALTAISVDTAERHRLTNPPPSSYGDSAPAISPDGRDLTFVRSHSLAVDDVLVQPLALSSPEIAVPRPLTHVGWPIMHLIRDTGKDALLFTTETGQLWRIPAAHPGTPQPVTSIGPAPIGTHVTLSPTGDNLVYTAFHSNLDLWRQDLPRPGTPPAAPVRLVSTSRSEANPRISPDGKHIAFASNRSGFYEIWICDSDGGNARQLTALRSYTGTPRWSPDGTRIAFDTRVNANADIYLVEVSSGEVRPFTGGPSNNMLPNWSRDGKWIYFASNRSGKDQLWKAPVAGGPAVQITQGGATGGSETGDGRYVCFSRTWGVTGVWRMASDGGKEEKLFDGLPFPLDFEVVADGVYYLRAPGAGDARWELLFYSFQSGRSERVASMDKAPENGLAISPDRRWFLFAASEPVPGDLMMVEHFR